MTEHGPGWFKKANFTVAHLLNSPTRYGFLSYVFILVHFFNKAGNS